jgi:starch-binding outer membrane protein SusE/F
MKTILRKSIFALTGLLALGSCNVDDNNTVATAEGAAKLLTPATGTTLVLLPGNANNVATTLVWDFSKNGVDSPATYTVQIAKGGTNFATPINAGSSDGTYLSWTVEQLNGKMDPLVFTPYQEANVDVRIKSDLGTGLNALVQYSNIITLKITPYSLALPKLGVPGNHQGWNPPTAPILASSGFGKTNYEGYVSLNGGYKFLNPKTDGTFAWGTDADDWSDDGTFSGTLVQLGGSDCTATAGYYLVKANTGITSAQNPGGLSYTTTPITRWDITGDATPLGWPDAATNGNNSAPMTYNATTKKWSITIALTGGKEIKFRANNAWSIDLGKFDPTKTGNNYGGENMSYGGPNIPIATSGNYIVTLDLSSPRDYKYSVVLQ